MKVYNIKFKETRTAYFGVEAASEEEALERFEQWRMADEHIYTALDNNLWNIYSDASICKNARADDDDVLTDEMYNNL